MAPSWWIRQGRRFATAFVDDSVSSIERIGCDMFVTVQSPLFNSADLRVVALGRWKTRLLSEASEWDALIAGCLSYLILSLSSLKPSPTFFIYSRSSWEHQVNFQLCLPIPTTMTLDFSCRHQLLASNTYKTGCFLNPDGARLSIVYIHFRVHDIKTSPTRDAAPVFGCDRCRTNMSITASLAALCMSYWLMSHLCIC